MTKCNKETMVYVNWIYRYYGFKKFFLCICICTEIAHVDVTFSSCLFLL